MFLGKFTAPAFALAVAASATGACAMSTPESGQQGHCTVIGAEKLPAEVGGANALCAALERAVSAKVPGLHYSAELRVASPSVLIANIVVNGRKLPEQRFGVMDRNLNSGSIHRFAETLANLLAQSSKG